MAKNRFGSKKKGKKGRKSSRVSAKRRAAGKKAWRTRVRRFGSKAAAVRASFGGKRGRKGKKGRKGKSSVRRYDKYTTTLRRIAYEKALGRVKAKLGTSGQSVTERERKIAARIARGVGGRRGPMMSSEERHRMAFKERLAKEKRNEASRRVAYDLKTRAEARRRAEHDASVAEQEARINSEMASL